MSRQAMVTFTGKAFYFGPWGTKASKVEYDGLISEWLANGRRRPSLAPSDLTLEKLVAAF